MNCEKIREMMPDVAAGMMADAPEVEKHLAGCAGCAGQLEQFRQTMALLDEWEVPEPSPYFLTRLRAHVKEEREKAPARLNVFGWLRRPAMAVSLATLLLAAGLIYRVALVEPPPPQEGSALADVEALDRNHEVLTKTDLIDEMSGAPSEDVTDEID